MASPYIACTCLCGHVTPEAQSGGPLSVVRDGDAVEIDVDGRTIDLLVDEGELARRLSEWAAPAEKY